MDRSKTRDAVQRRARGGADAELAPGRSTLTASLLTTDAPGAAPAPGAPSWGAALVDEHTARAHGLVQFDPSAAPDHEDPDRIHALAEAGTQGPGGALPHLDAIQRSFGHHDVRGVVAHVGGAAAAAATEMSALAYASGDHVAFSREPDLHLAAHEAAHVVQQRGGVRLSDGVGRSGDAFEAHADAVADRVVGGESAEALLDRYAHRGAAGGAATQRQVMRWYEGNPTIVADRRSVQVAIGIAAQLGRPNVREIIHELRRARRQRPDEGGFVYATIQGSPRRLHPDDLQPLIDEANERLRPRARPTAPRPADMEFTPEEADEHRRQHAAEEETGPDDEPAEPEPASPREPQAEGSQEHEAPNQEPTSELAPLASRPAARGTGDLLLYKSPSKFSITRLGQGELEVRLQGYVEGSVPTGDAPVAGAPGVNPPTGESRIEGTRRVRGGASQSGRTSVAVTTPADRLRQLCHEDFSHHFEVNNEPRSRDGNGTQITWGLTTATHHFGPIDYAARINLIRNARGQLRLEFPSVTFTGSTQQEVGGITARVRLDITVSLNTAYVLEQASRLLERGGEQAARQGGERAAREGGERAAQEGGEHAAREGGERAAREGGELAAREGGELAAREGTELAAREGTELAAREGGELAAREGGQRAAREGGQVAAREGGELVAREGGELAAREGGQLAAREGGQVVAREGGELAAREAAERLGREGAEHAAEAAAGRVAREGVEEAAVLGTRAGLRGALGTAAHVAGHVIEPIMILVDFYEAMAYISGIIPQIQQQALAQIKVNDFADILSSWVFGGRNQHEARVAIVEHQAQGRAQASSGGAEYVQRWRAALRQARQEAQRAFADLRQRNQVAELRQSSGTQQALYRALGEQAARRQGIQFSPDDVQRDLDGSVDQGTQLDLVPPDRRAAQEERERRRRFAGEEGASATDAPVRELTNRPRGASAPPARPSLAGNEDDELILSRIQMRGIRVETDRAPIWLSSGIEVEVVAARRSGEDPSGLDRWTVTMRIVDPMPGQETISEGDGDRVPNQRGQTFQRTILGRVSDG